MGCPTQVKTKNGGLLIDSAVMYTGRPSVSYSTFTQLMNYESLKYILLNQ
jgi:hypothetical protein